MSKRASHSHLQNRILLLMENYEVDSIVKLAGKLDSHRSSVSRSMHTLEAIGLVSKTNGCWGLSATGKEEVERIRGQFPERTTKVVETVNRLFDQTRLSAIGSAMSKDLLNPYYTAISDAASVILKTAAQSSLQSLISSVANVDSFALAREAAQPLINAVAGVDLLASTEDAMQSLANVATRFDSLSLVQESTQQLLNTAASVELITSAQDAMQSLTSVAARFCSSALNQHEIQPLLDAAISFDSLKSAQNAILPLIEATVRFDSQLMADIILEPLSIVEKENHTLSLAQDAIQPLVSAATRFDAITLGQETIQSLLKQMGSGNFLASVQEHSGVLPNLTTDSLVGISAIEIMKSAQLTSGFDAIKSISLKPSVFEIAASQTFQGMDDISRNIMADIYPRLTNEALTSFSQSQRLSLASIEQISTLGYAASNILSEFSKANLELGNIINDIGVITAQDHIKSNWIAMIPNMAEVGRTYKGFLADVVSDLAKSLIDYKMNVGITIPTTTTSAFINSMKTAIVADETDDDDVILRDIFPASRRDRATQLDVVFQGLGPNYIAMWQGSWVVLDSNSPDRIRQAAHSGRELLMQILANLAPDSAFDALEIEKNGYEGKVTRKMRVKKILGSDSKSAVGWVDAMAKALEETYNRLAEVSHDRNPHPQSTEQQLVGLLYSLGGLVSFIDAFQHKNTGNK
jgi:predicted transcriptional regulator